MLISDSMPLLWLCYAVLSLVVVVTGYLAIHWLPRLPRFVITGLVAGALWMPAGFTLPAIENGEAYEGRAPAVVVASVAYLQDDSFGGALALLLLGAGLGAAVGVLLWAWLHYRTRRSNDGENETNNDDRPAPTGHTRREPGMG